MKHLLKDNTGKCKSLAVTLHSLPVMSTGGHYSFKVIDLYFTNM